MRNVITEEVIKRYNSLERALTTIKLKHKVNQMKPLSWQSFTLNLDC
jgi:hypothetical protein